MTSAIVVSILPHHCSLYKGTIVDCPVHPRLSCSSLSSAMFVFVFFVLFSGFCCCYMQLSFLALFRSVFHLLALFPFVYMLFSALHSNIDMNIRIYYLLIYVKDSASYLKIVMNNSTLFFSVCDLSLTDMNELYLLNVMTVMYKM